MEDSLASIRDFIAAYVNSVEQLEVLLLMRENRDKHWAASEVSQRLASQEGSVAIRLVDLESKGLLRSKVAGSKRLYRYAPDTPSLETSVNDLAEFYKIYRLKVFQLIYDKSNESVRLFSEAFKLWKRGKMGAE